ncbi:methyltransferase family protein [Pararhizobium haloflavum]|uniref:methyltransferase family protein n=1 Tax=Pararhizobium haloflavum TaxID=2037914 RepID=UPI000C1956C1|nr:isoprenylcysteine carboxylmethyltransferase family protein [Pararhizobium haloflavum]
MDDPASSRVVLQKFQRLRRLVLASILGAVILALLFVRSRWQSEAIHETIEILGLACIAAGILGRLWCTLYIGGRKADEIVDGGPYSITRNPLYLFSTLAAAGVGAQTGSLLVTAFFAIGSALAFHVVIAREEQYLAERFGDPYAAYMARVPRFLPRPSLFQTDDVLTVRPARLYRTFADGLVFFLAMPLLETVEYLQDSGVLPVILHLY